MSNKQEILKIGISEFDSAVIAMLQAKEKLANLILTLPQNEDIEVLNKNCFIIKYSKLNEKGLELSPEFYNFNAQYSAISEKIIASTDVKKDLLAIIDKKSVQIYKNAGYMTLRLHPAVAENLKSLVGDGQV